MTSRIVLPAFLAIGLAFMPMASFAKGGGGKSAPKATPNHHHTTIESVSATSITVSAADGVKTYKIASSTEITFKGQSATASQLQTGMRVQVVPDAVDETIAGEIQADDAPVDPTPKPKK
jgi:hypothetical protein